MSMSAHGTLSANVWNGSVRLVSGNLGLFLGIRRTLPFRRLAKKVPCAECRRRQNPWTRKWAFLSLPMKFKVTWPCLTSSLLWHSIIKGPVQSKSMFISIDQLPKMIEFHTIIVHKYSSVDFILIFEWWWRPSWKTYRTVFWKTVL